VQAVVMQAAVVVVVVVVVVAGKVHSLYGLQYENRWFMCWLYEPECENRFMHLEHWNGFSPLCSRLCSVRWCLCLNAFGHTSHLCGL